MAARRVSELDMDALRRREFFPSPAAWEDEVLYFLLLDRFSDGDESDAASGAEVARNSAVAHRRSDAAALARGGPAAGSAARCAG